MDVKFVIRGAGGAVTNLGMLYSKLMIATIDK